MKVILIGGSKGLGLSIKDKLEEAGCDVVALNRSAAKPYDLDLTWPAEMITERIKYAVDLLGGCDALIVSSGMGAYLPPTVSAGKVEELFKTNVLGPMTVFRAANRALLKSKGKAIFISSITSRKPSSGGLSYYAGTKGALNSWATAESRRQAKHGVAVCTVSPGYFESPMTEDIHPKLKAASIKNIPSGRFGECDEIADFVISLLEQTNWVIAGSNYECTGGA